MVDFSNIVTYYQGDATEMTVSYAGFPGGDGTFPPIVLEKLPHVQIKSLQAAHDVKQCQSPNLPVSGKQLTITLGQVAVAPSTRVQAPVYFDYDNVTGIDDGIDVATLAIAPAVTAPPSP